jgi:hypothetical protein
MARFLVIWRVNPAAPWPTDPSKTLEMLEMMWAGIDELMKKGEIEEMGSFPESNVGYTISRGEAIDAFRRASTFYPFFVFEIHEIIPYEKQKEILRAVCKAQTAAMKK